MILLLVTSTVYTKKGNVADEKVFVADSNNVADEEVFVADEEVFVADSDNVVPNPPSLHTSQSIMKK